MRAKSIALLMGVVALGGCAVRYPNYYALNPDDPVPARSNAVPISGTVAIREFGAPAYLRQGPIVYRPEPDRIAFYNYHQWAEDPRRTVTAVVVRDLQQTFQSAALYDGHGDADFLLTGSLDHLEEVDGGPSVSVDVGISATLKSFKTGAVIWSGTASKTSAVEQRSVPGVVTAMSRELSEAAGQLVASMRKELLRNSPAR